MPPKSLLPETVLFRRQKGFQGKSDLGMGAFRTHPPKSGGKTINRMAISQWGRSIFFAPRAFSAQRFGEITD